jgi:amino acid transporter
VDGKGLLSAREPVESPVAPDDELERYGRYRLPRRRAPLIPALELHEVRQGLKPGSRYFRLTPRNQLVFLRQGRPDLLQVTEAGLRPRTAVEATWRRFKRVLVGPPLATSQVLEERLNKTQALGVFSSDPLSSSAYSAEEIMLVLALAGAGALYLTLPVTAALLLLLWTVRLSYLQTIRAYPSGGGAYIVARENLGQVPALVAAAALLVDYVLTVSVSVAAGVAAITSAAPGLLDSRVLLALLAVAIVTLGNLRGIRQSGIIFGLPTYFFILSFGSMILIGLVKVGIGDAPGSLLHAAEPVQRLPVLQGLSLFLILRAFSSGAAALTGVEAISNGVPAFKPPESQNARTTMQWEAALLGFLLLGVAYLSTRYGLVPSPDQTLVSKLGSQVLGQNVAYYAYQVATAGVLFLAANTAYADFPRLAAILGRDRFAPQQLAFRGDRLAFSQGVVLLGVAASLLLVAFDAQVSRLIPLYVLGVFISMTLSQVGMVRHWLRFPEKGWRGSIAFNAIGAAATGLVTLIVASSKFTQGAWLSVLAMLGLVVTFTLIHRHYRRVAEQLEVVSPSPNAAPQARPHNQPVLVPVYKVNEAVRLAVDYARKTSENVTALHVSDDVSEADELRQRWEEVIPDVPLVVIESPYRSFIIPILTYIDALDRSHPGETITVLLPELVPARPWHRFLHNQSAAPLKKALRARPNTLVVNVPYRLRE